MKNKILIYCLIAFIVNCSGQDLSFPDSIINLAQLKLLNHSQINYNCRYFSKGISSIDTSVLLLNVKIKKTDNQATLYNKVITTFDTKRPTYEFKAFYENNFGYYYSLDKLNKKGTFKKFKGEGTDILGYFHSGLRYFIDSTILNYYKSKISLASYLGIDTIQNFKTYKFQIQTADIPPVKNYKTIFYFNVEDFMLVRILNTYDVNSESSIHDYQIINYNFKNEVIDSFYYLPELSNYTITYDTLNKKQIEYPLINHRVNEIVGTNIRTLEKEIITFKNKITVLDFWFMGCYGCILSYPIIDSLYKNYSNYKKIQFIGLNSIDTDNRLIERRKKYLTDYKISYRNYLIDKITFEKFKENTMPFFLIIDEDGIIKYQSVGYNIELYKELNNQIKKLLNK